VSAWDENYQQALTVQWQKYFSVINLWDGFILVFAGQMSSLIQDWQ